MPNLSFAIMGKPPAYRYHLLRNALEAFQKNLPHLDEKEFNRVCQGADRSFHLESLALQSPEASQILIQPEGKKRMAVDACLRGFHIEPGTRIS